MLSCALSVGLLGLRVVGSHSHLNVVSTKAAQVMLLFEVVRRVSRTLLQLCLPVVGRLPSGFVRKGRWWQQVRAAAVHVAVGLLYL
jgi:hypothetical protein